MNGTGPSRADVDKAMNQLEAELRGLGIKADVARLGTEWVADLQGSTLNELWNATASGATEQMYKIDRHLERLAGCPHLSHRDGWLRRTNLRLTGAPLTAADLENIARAK